MMGSMNRPADIEWTVFASRGLAVVRSYGLGRDWLRSEKETPMMTTGVEIWQVTQGGDQRRDQATIANGNLGETGQDLENRDLIERRPKAGASCLSADATVVPAGEAA